MLPVKPQYFIICKSLKHEPEKSGVASGDFTAVTNRMQPTKKYFKARCHLNVTHMRTKNMYISVDWKT